MTDIMTIPDAELKKDLDETFGDILTCQAALKLGIETYANGESVRRRLDTNEKIKDKIEAELKRRAS